MHSYSLLCYLTSIVAIVSSAPLPSASEHPKLAPGAHTHVAQAHATASSTAAVPSNSGLAAVAPSQQSSNNNDLETAKIIVASVFGVGALGLGTYAIFKLASQIRDDRAAKESEIQKLLDKDYDYQEAIFNNDITRGIGSPLAKEKPEQAPEMYEKQKAKDLKEARKRAEEAYAAKTQQEEELMKADLAGDKAFVTRAEEIEQRTVEFMNSDSGIQRKVIEIKKKWRIGGPEWAKWRVAATKSPLYHSARMQDLLAKGEASDLAALQDNTREIIAKGYDLKMEEEAEKLAAQAAKSGLEDSGRQEAAEAEKKLLQDANAVPVAEDALLGEEVAEEVAELGGKEAKVGLWDAARAFFGKLKP